MEAGDFYITGPLIKALTCYCRCSGQGPRPRRRRRPHDATWRKNGRGCIPGKVEEHGPEVEEEVCSARRNIQQEKGCQTASGSGLDGSVMISLHYHSLNLLSV